MKSMGDKNTCFSRETLLENILENGFTDMGVESRERVLE